MKRQSERNKKRQPIPYRTKDSASASIFFSDSAAWKWCKWQDADAYALRSHQLAAAAASAGR
eukprot:2022097-Amphidinium_carterae.1